MTLNELAIYVAPVIGIITLIIGVAAFLNPLKMSAKFGIAASETSGALPYVQATGIRDVFMGIAVIVTFYHEEWKSLAMICLGLAMVAASDFAVVKKYGDQKISLIHFGGAVATSVYALWLFNFK